ncbi:type IV secretion system protein [Campylobacter cuniculorum]|uniref:Type IV secretion system protein n=2 Tax=Campylobacter cuniculorum TaxID=374106 RepID=A0ABX6TXR4_9BACT|nr:type IV secretion system protein [Campylobacter cuniculorum]ARJ57101.1 putative type IV secretion system protein VirB5 [Campylobacter cuniculorum DSM 23162 = LMG 24588]QOR04546.1 hypothetical protein A0071_00935 [Campylobacter cuniculorum]
MKKKVFSLITSFALSFNVMYGAGIPVVDLGSIAEAVKQYNQMMKEYEQMLKDTSNFEQQMSEFGVGMNNVSDILGDLNSMVNSMQSIYNDITNIPQDFLGNVEQVTRACSFLQTQSPYFKQKLNSYSNAINNDFNRCTSGIKNNADITKSIDELMKKIEKSTDYEERQRYYVEIENIRQAQAFLQAKANEEQTNKIIAFYETYHKKDKNNPYTKEKMSEDLKSLSKALAKPNNQKQAQALTNTILIKILEILQRQYELNMEYSNALVNFSQNTGANQSYSLSEESYKAEYEQQPFNQDLLFFKDAKAYEKDKNGLPVFTIGGNN